MWIPARFRFLMHAARKSRARSATTRGNQRSTLDVEILEDRCVPSAGALDPTFGSGGIVTTSPN